MSIIQFIIKSLWFFRKQHLAVLAGTIVSTAVLTGALIIGDSVKDSLRNMVDTRLGNTRFALQSGERFIRADLANDLSKKLEVDAASILLLNGIGINPETKARINKTQVLGIDENFWKLNKLSPIDLKNGEAIISENVANKLDLQLGDNFLLRFENLDIIPINTPFSQESTPSVGLRLQVKDIANDKGFGRFSLKNNQTIPDNIFISQTFLSSKLELKGKANTILLAQNDSGTLNPDEVNITLKESWQLEDVELKIHELEKGKIEVLSNRIFIDKPISHSIQNINIPNKKILTILVNEIETKGRNTPYSFVSAMSLANKDQVIRENDIFINTWLADDLNAVIGDTLNLSYFVVGPLRKLTEKQKKFIVKAILPIEGKVFNKNLMPEFPGLADAGSCSEWDTGIPIDLDKIRDKDEEYWDVYKGTPKAIIPIETGIQIWGNSFGNYTSIRFNTSNVSVSELQTGILNNLDPKDLNLAFLPVYDYALQAVSNSVDFGELFLSLSFFVIAAGILLTILIYSLNTESRKIETGVLAAMGLNRKLIRNLRFYESVLIVIVGGILGSLLGILYNYGVIKALNSVWTGAVQTSILEVSIRPTTLIIGALSGILIAISSIYLVTTKKLKTPLAELIRNAPIYTSSGRRLKLNTLIIFFSFALVLLILFLSFTQDVDINPGLFMGAGGLFLIGAIASVNHFLTSLNKKSDITNFNLQKLAIKNSGRNKVRTLITISLLALGTFSVIITGANRKTFSGTSNINSSGTGGYKYWIETVIPIAADLNDAQARNKLGFDDENFKGYEFLQFFKLDGDDASCLNLNQVEQPQILGVDAKVLSHRQSFSFAKLLDGVDQEKTWEELNNFYEDDIIPAIADQTVITWGLKKKIGDTLFYNDEHGKLIKLLLIGGLNNSIFQGNILIAEKYFHDHFPSTGGSQLILMDINEEGDEKLKHLLQNRLQDYGIEITSTSDRLAAFYTVENTYLSVFMILGGLGMIIGTIGLGIVLIRNILERKQEFALLLAVGFNARQVLRVIQIENIFILIIGMLLGFIAAIIGVLPSLLSPAFVIPGYFVFIITMVIFLSGMISIWIPSRNAIKGNLIDSLRNE